MAGFSIDITRQCDEFLVNLCLHFWVFHGCLNLLVEFLLGSEFLNQNLLEVELEMVNSGVFSLTEDW